MKIILILGYKELFGKLDNNYNELVEKLPSEVVISLIIVINNELNVPMPEEENQKRLREKNFGTFSEQAKRLNDAYYRYRQKTQGAYQEHVFGRRYLLAMILKELNNFRSFK